MRVSDDTDLRVRAAVLLRELEAAEERVEHVALVRHTCGPWVCDHEGAVKNRPALDTAIAVLRWMLRQEEG